MVCRTISALNTTCGWRDVSQGWSQSKVNGAYDRIRLAKARRQSFANVMDSTVVRPSSGDDRFQILD